MPNDLGLFCDDINVRAVEYANRRRERSKDPIDRLIWQSMVDAYVEGACSQYNIDNKSNT